VELTKGNISMIDKDGEKFKLAITDFIDMKDEEWYPNALKHIFQHTPLPPKQKEERKQREIKEQYTYESLNLTNTDISNIDENYWREDNETMKDRSKTNINECDYNRNYYGLDEELDSSLYIKDETAGSSGELLEDILENQDVD